VSSLSRDTSDHTPCLISIPTDVPKAKVFRFENYWLLHDDFMQVIEHGWSVPTFQSDKAKVMTAKLKNLRRVLRAWQFQLSNLSTTISNNKVVLCFLDMLEKSHDLTLEEWNFRRIIQEHLANLLEQQRVYWKQRGKITWATLGDENTKFFHSTATIRKNKNGIRSLIDEQGLEKFVHDEKASILWESFR
jgi:hypothetical protein